MKKYAELNKPADYQEGLRLQDEDISEFMIDEMSESVNES